MHGCGRVGMRFSAQRCVYFIGVCAGAHASVPRRKVIRIRQARKETSHVDVDLWVSHQHGVIDIPCFLPPRPEDYLHPGVVWMQRSYQAPSRIVEQNRTDADLDTELETMCGAKKRLVPADSLSLVVEDGPAAANPAQRAGNIVDFLWCSLDFFLNLATETI